jgi:hypothetical protein
MKQQIKILLGLLLLVSACKDPSIKDIDFSKGNYSLYFIDPVYLSGDSASLNKCEFQKEYRIFKIQDTNVLKHFQNDYIKKPDKGFVQRENSCFYVLELIKERKIEWGGFIDWQNKIISNQSEKFSLDIDKFKNDSLSFILVPSYKIKIHELQVARKLYNLLVESGSYIYGIQYLEENPLFSYNGELVLKTDTTKLPMNREHEEIENEILNDFKGLGKIKISRFYFNIDTPEITINIHSESNISNSIPKKYRIHKAYRSLENAELNAIDIDELKLTELIEKNELKGITYEKL